MDELNLDFLDTTPISNRAERVDSPYVYNEFDVNFCQNKTSSKRFQMAQTVAKVDELVKEIDKLKSQNSELQQQIKDLQVTAHQVEELYTKEKMEHASYKCNFDKLQKEYNKIDVDFTNMCMVNDQLKARLAEYDGRPINFDSLVVKYLKIMIKLEGDEKLKYNHDKYLIERLREYCSNMKLKIPQVNSPKKSKSRANKNKTEGAPCDLELASLENQNCAKCRSKGKVSDENTQHSKTTHDQASQYISTMITRQTSTEKIVQKHVQTMFPEPPDINDILKVYSSWSNIRSISPLLQSPERKESTPPKEKLKIFSNSGTCTMLCNIRRKIDYLPPNNSSSIKEEFFTPSASPIPTSSPLTNGSKMSSHHPSITSDSTNHNSFVNLLNFNANSSLEQISSNAFNELWKIFGKLLLSLLQSHNNESANTNQTSPLNQQQFLDWLMDLYLNSQLQNTSNMQASALEQIDTNVSTNLLFFNDESVYTTNTIRPLPQKPIPEENNIARTNGGENQASISIKTSSIDNSNRQLLITDSSNTPLNNSQDSNSIDNEVQEITLSTNISQPKIIFESSLHELQVQNTKKKRTHRVGIPKAECETLTKIQAILPEINLNKKKRKALRKIIKTYNGQKSLGCRKNNKFIKQSPVVILPSDYKNDDKLETAVDFLKTFSATQQSNEPIESFSETEKIFLEQISNKNITNNIPNILPTEQFTFIKPCRNLTHEQPISNVSERILESTTLKSSCQMENKLLHLEKPDIKHTEPVMRIDLKGKPLRTSTDIIPTTSAMNNKLWNLNYTQAFESLSLTNCTDKLIFSDVESLDSTNTSMDTNPLRENSSTPNLNCSQESLPHLRKFSKDIELTYLADILELHNAKDSSNINTNKLSANTFATNNKNSLKKIENNFANDFELFSDNNDEDPLEIKNSNKKAVNFKQIKDANIINNFIDKDKTTNEMFKTNEFNTNEMPALSESLIETNNIASENITDNYSCNDSTATHQLLFNSSLYANDIEKDLKLSSDDESDNELNFIKKFSSITNDKSGDDAFYKENFIVPQSDSVEKVYESKQKDDELSMLKESLNTDEINYSIEPNENTLENEVELVKTSIISSKSESSQAEYSNSDCILISSTEGEVENINTILNSKPKQREDMNGHEGCVASKYEYNPKKTNVEITSVQHFAANQQKDYEFHIFKERSEKICISNNEIQKESIKPFNSFEDKKHVEGENFLSQDIKSTNCLSDSYFTSKTIKRNIDDTSKLSDPNSQQLLYCITQNESEENSSVLSVITTESDEKLNIKQIPQKTNMKSNNENNLGNQYLSLNSIINTKEIKDSVNVEDKVKNNQIFEDESKINLPYGRVTAGGNTNKENFECPYISKVNQPENVAPSPITNISNTNNSENKIIDSACKQDCTEKIESTLENPAISFTESMSENVLPSYGSAYTTDEFNFNDNLSIENELIIDEETNENILEELNLEDFTKSTITESEENDDKNSCNISTLLNSTLCNEILTESISPIVDELLKEDVATTPQTLQMKRKRKIQCLSELQPCKRSQRLQAKRIVLEESLSLSKTPVELAQYKNRYESIINSKQLTTPIKDIKKKNLEHKCETTEKSKLFENENPIQLGFFKERDDEKNISNENFKTLTATISQEHETCDSKTFVISNEVSKAHMQDPQRQNSVESEQQDNEITTKCWEEQEKFNSENDSISKPSENIYTDSPQSPISTVSNSEDISETYVVIPLERPSEYMVKENNLTSLFDALINSYNNENQKQVLDTYTTKEIRRKEYYLTQLVEQLKSYCYSEMELDLYCTSARLINKLLSITPDYDLIQDAVITIVQNAKGTTMTENDFPSIIQEIPPRHLSKCLQRLFVFLKNVVTRNSSFCHDLISKIESLLFTYKQTDSTSLQVTLNLTQLYLMATKVQEYLQVPKHTARLFIAKCLYFYLQKSILMIHEVLMWYPTVLPHREDKTYDRSDALISVIQQILMNTRYDMDKPDLRGKLLLSKLRFEYHFEPFKPTMEEVITVLVEKLKNSKFYNISLAFGLFCKRIGVLKTENDVLNRHLLPLANDYYSLALKTNEYDKRIAVLLEIISMLVKPLPTDTNVQKYFCEFSRFLNGFERQLIQEAALCSLLRLQRFNVECCYNLLRNFQPTYNLNIHTQAMLKSFLYRRPLKFWKKLKSQNPKN